MFSLTLCSTFNLCVYFFICVWMREKLKSVLILLLFCVCEPLRELYLVGIGIRMNLSAEESATPERGDLVEIFLPPLGLILGGFLGKRDVSIFQMYAFLKKSILFDLPFFLFNCSKTTSLVLFL